MAHLVRGRQGREDHHIHQADSHGGCGKYPRQAIVPPYQEQVSHCRQYQNRKYHQPAVPAVEETIP